MPSRRIRVLGAASDGPAHLFQHQHVTARQSERGGASGERGRRGARAQRAALLAPRVEADRVTRHRQCRHLVQGLERHVTCGLAGPWLVGHAGAHGQRRSGAGAAVDVGPEDQPRACIGAVVQVVVDEPSVPAHRRPAACGAEIRFGGDRVLVVTELVAGVRKQLHERDAHVCRTAIAPVGQGGGEAIEQQSPEARIVLREVVQVRRRTLLGRTLDTCDAVGVGGAVHLERERHVRQDGIESWRRHVVEQRGDQSQRIRREVAGAIDTQRHDRPCGRDDGLDRDAADPHAALDGEVRGRERVAGRNAPALARQGMHEVHVQHALVRRIDLQEIDAVQERLVGVVSRLTHEHAPAGCATGEAFVRHPRLPTRTAAPATRRCGVGRT